MLIEVLYMPGCPHHQPAVERLKNILQAIALDTPIQEIAVTDTAMACSLRFPGSPTIRINGMDAEPGSAHTFGLACRLYSTGTGLPPEEVLQTAISTAKMREESA